MELLRIYLQDHCATCTGALELAKRTYGANRGTEFEQPLRELREEIAADRAALLDAMRRLGVERDRVKEGAAWAAEKAGRLKLNGRLRGYSPLSRVVELEGLAMLLCGQRRAWEALERATVGDPRMAGFDVAPCAARTDEQLARVTELHGRAVALAFARSPAPA
jgi:hypothetical protein